MALKSCFQPPFFGYFCYICATIKSKCLIDFKALFFSELQTLLFCFKRQVWIKLEDNKT